jgi:hypothetical protein
LNCAGDASSCLYQGAGNPDGLFLRLDSYVVKNVSATATSITLTGTCSDGGIAHNRIYWEMLDSAGHVQTTSLLQALRTGCAQGAFSEIISGFTTGAGVAKFAAGTSLQIRLIINGMNDQGSLVSPANINQASTIQSLMITP